LIPTYVTVRTYAVRKSQRIKIDLRELSHGF